MTVDDKIFGGFLLNPIDGNSYLAKMQLGWNGDWKFHLLYSADVSEGIYIFLFYIFLGHLAKWLGISLIVLFHAVRILASAWLIWSIWKFLNWAFSESPPIIDKLFFIILLGTGLGWLPFFFGVTTSDFWVAEAFPFLSMYENPHFPLGMACLLWVLLANKYGSPTRQIILAINGFALSIIMPFGLLIALMAIGGETLWLWFKERKLAPGNLLFLLISGAPIVAYQYWFTLQDPLLRIWNSQNQTPSPSLWDFLISFSPAIVFAIYEVWQYRKKVFASEPVRLLAIWMIIGLILIYFPFGLQRRFMFAYAIPCFVLGGMGLQQLINRYRKKGLWLVFIGSSIITTFLIIMLGIFGIQSRNSLLYYEKSEQLAFAWIMDNTDVNAVFLSSPETGMYIPALTGRRVVYGHPFETANAETEKEFVEDFYGAPWDIMDAGLLKQLGVDYIFWGPREEEINGLPASCHEVFRVEDVVICDLAEP